MTDEIEVPVSSTKIKHVTVPVLAEKCAHCKSANVTSTSMGRKLLLHCNKCKRHSMLHLEAPCPEKPGQPN